ncbi:hypothetical protein HYH03_014267 [Edaphochlamys debaryana]|uniref:DNA (cytosine-5-)-methyltransferase n=1 Tax=Edaphochlamys debaryana TaxID=47281 RepID=A0A835XPA8_9CHLO|nr:hypothetical protein HYH03_014267 [Edaphochlamys debaryana]|eukprot:KAG2487155.1 hypothetical protein HYH03_014267 [Edaphochlamys debaryana]
MSTEDVGKSAPTPAPEPARLVPTPPHSPSSDTRAPSPAPSTPSTPSTPPPPLLSLPDLAVRCRDTPGRLLPSRLEVACACPACGPLPPPQRLFSAPAWERHCGAAASKDWKRSVKVLGPAAAEVAAEVAAGARAAAAAGVVFAEPGEAPPSFEVWARLNGLRVVSARGGQSRWLEVIGADSPPPLPATPPLRRRRPAASSALSSPVADGSSSDPEDISSGSSSRRGSAGPKAVDPSGPHPGLPQAATRLVHDIWAAYFDSLAQKDGGEGAGAGGGDPVWAQTDAALRSAAEAHQPRSWRLLDPRPSRAPAGPRGPLTLYTAAEAPAASAASSSSSGAEATEAPPPLQLRPGSVVLLAGAGGGEGGAGGAAGGGAYSFALVQAIFTEGGEGAEPRLQLRPLVHGRSTLLGDAADPLELFLLDPAPPPAAPAGAGASAASGGLGGTVGVFVPSPTGGSASSSSSSASRSRGSKGSGSGVGVGQQEGAARAEGAAEGGGGGVFEAPLGSVAAALEAECFVRPAPHAQHAARRAEDEQADAARRERSAALLRSGAPPVFALRQRYQSRQAAFLHLGAEELGLGEVVQPPAPLPGPTLLPGGGGFVKDGVTYRVGDHIFLPPTAPLGSPYTAAAASPPTSGADSDADSSSSASSDRSSSALSGSSSSAAARRAARSSALGRPWQVVRLLGVGAAGEAVEGSSSGGGSSGGGGSRPAASPRLVLKVRRLFRPEDHGLPSPHPWLLTEEAPAGLASVSSSGDPGDTLADPLTDLEEGGAETGFGGVVAGAGPRTLAAEGLQAAAQRQRQQRQPCVEAEVAAGSALGRCVVQPLGGRGSGSASEEEQEQDAKGAGAASGDVHVFRLVPAAQLRAVAASGDWSALAPPPAPAAATAAPSEGAAAGASAAGSRERPRPLASMDMFAGAGGLSRGLHMSGVADTRWAIELDAPAASAFAANFPTAAVMAEDCTVLLAAAAAKAAAASTSSSGALPRPPPAEVVTTAACAAAAARLPPALAARLPLPGEVELLAGGPPCQGFSNKNAAGRGGVEAHLKCAMIPAYLSFADLYRPRFFLLENVPGFLRPFRGEGAGGAGARGGLNYYFRLALRTLLGMGYQVRFGVLLAGHYGVAQSRQRAFIWASAPGEPLPDWPQPLTAFALPPSGLALPGGVHFAGGVPGAAGPAEGGVGGGGAQGAALRAVAVGDCIGELPELAEGEWGWPQLQPNPSPGPASAAFQPPCPAAAPAPAALTDHATKPLKDLHVQIMRLVPQGGDWTALKALVGEGAGSAASPEVLAWVRKEMAAELADGEVGQRLRGTYGRVRTDGWFRTVATNMTPRAFDAWNVHPTQARMYTVREAARAQGFPDCHLFAGSHAQRYKQVGNAVPPPLAAALGLRLAAALEAHATEAEAEEAGEAGEAGAARP